jgi:BirA family transcriptional regulator, biotin operon repressor / biotin---[acetyl-CoA-carboxylase] ligase
MEIENNIIIGSVIIRVAQVESTNAHLKQMAAQLQEGAVVVAENQTGGKGRYGRFWFSDAGSLTFSILIRPQLELSQLPWLALFTAVSAARALQSMKINAAIKWPNDLELNGRKIGGILVENTVKSDGAVEAVIGIGLNVNQTGADFPKQIRQHAASLKSASDNHFDKEKFLTTLLHFLDEGYKRFFKPFRTEAIKSEWLSLCGHRNATVTVTLNGKKIQGTFIDLTETGAAILNVDDRKVVVDNFDAIEEFYAADD